MIYMHKVKTDRRTFQVGFVIEGLKDSTKARSLPTVNSEIFARILFSRDFAYAKFRENKIFEKWRNHSSFTDISKPCPSRDFLTFQICLLTLFVKIKFSRKFPNLQYVKCMPC